jgi:hypothetical protein
LIALSNPQTAFLDEVPWKISLFCL